MSGGIANYTWTRAGASVAGLALLALVIHRDTVLYLTGFWNQLAIGDYGHGYLVVGISLYLVIENRRVLSGMTPCPGYWGLVLLTLASLLWLLATFADVQAAKTVALLVLLLSVVWIGFGTQLLWKLLFPILFVGFAIPIWFPLSPLLQSLTADTVFGLMRALAIPAYKEANVIVVPGGTLFVEEACSGLRYLLAALTLGTLYAYMNYTSFGARVLVVLVAAGAAVLANIVRVFIVVYLAYATDMQHPLVHDHLSLGWYLFGGLVVMLLVVDLKLNRVSQKKTDQVAPAAGIVEAAPANCRVTNIRQAVLVLVSAAIVGAGPAFAYWVNTQPYAENQSGVLELPAGRNGWAGPFESGQNWMPVYHGAVGNKQRYQKDDNWVDLYVGYYPVQRQGEELINQLNQIADKKNWRSVYPHASLREVDGRRVREQIIKNADGDQVLIWYWYVVAGQAVTGNYEAKLLQALGVVTGKPESAIVAMATEHLDDRGKARAVLEEFLMIMYEPLIRLGQTHKGAD